MLRMITPMSIVESCDNEKDMDKQTCRVFSWNSDTYIQVRKQLWSSFLFCNTTAALQWPTMSGFNCYYLYFVNWNDMYEQKNDISYCFLRWFGLFFSYNFHTLSLFLLLMSPNVMYYVVFFLILLVWQNIFRNNIGDLFLIWREIGMGFPFRNHEWHHFTCPWVA